MSYHKDIDEALKYLETGGLGEVAGLADIAHKAGSEKVQMDTDMAIALCILAQETINSRSAQ